jgi:transposase
MKAMCDFGPGIHVLGAERVSAEWVISVSASGDGICPACGCHSNARHSRYWRRLRDLPMHGIPVVVRLRVARLRCREATCDQKIFAEQPAGLAEPLLRRTCQVVDILQALGHAAGGKPAERILSRLGLRASDDTVLHHLKRRARSRSPRASLRVVGIDDWSWTRGQTYGTIMVDLERRGGPPATWASRSSTRGCFVSRDYLDTARTSSDQNIVNFIRFAVLADYGSRFAWACAR